MCGRDGSSVNSCVLEGGESHILIEGQLRNVIVKGLTMRSAKSVSVEIGGRPAADVIFEDCRWEVSFK